MKLTLRVLTFISIFLTSLVMVNANPISSFEEFTNHDINDMLAKQFPIEKTYKGVTAVFSDPKVNVLTHEKTVEISVVINATYQKQTLTAKGRFVGNLEYYDFDETLSFKQPFLKHFYITENNMTDSLPAERAIQQSMSRDFDDMQLIDLKPYEFDAGMRSPDDIQFSIDKIIIHWN